MCRQALSWMCALAAVLAATGGCSKKSDGSGSATRAAPGGSAEPAVAGATKLTVAGIAIVDCAPVFLAKQKGFFSEQNLDVTVQTTQGGAESVPGVVSGQFQFAFANVVSLLLAHAKGLQLKLIAPGNFSTGKAEDFGAIIVTADSPAKTLKDLEGKTLSVNQINNIGGVTVRAAMRKAGADPDKVKLIEVSFPQMPAELAQKQIDAAWVVEPFLTVARNQGARVLDWNFADAAPTLMIAAYFTTEDYARNNPDIVKRFTAAIGKSLSYAADHPDDVRAALLTFTKIDKAVADKINLPLFLPQIRRESIDVLADLMVQDKLLTSKPDIDALLR